ncbi:hypothetical protein [Arthrobacter sp. SX1312]|uniref:hypothetical protein n=1 Tax=Arthrobacter sp. SX1312 TaxID=2058896 RepID=UPI000CE47D88|nr:hypothetical protein [Arthrobacter sp. SX1312]
MTAVAVAFGGLEAALLAAWHLLTARKKGSPPGRSKQWVDAMAVSLCLMALLIAGICLHAGSVARVGGPAMLLGLLGSVAFVAVVIVSRSRALACVLDADGTVSRVRSG